MRLCHQLCHLLRRFCVCVSSSMREKYRKCINRLPQEVVAFLDNWRQCGFICGFIMFLSLLNSGPTVSLVFFMLERWDEWISCEYVWEHMRTNLMAALRTCGSHITTISVHHLMYWIIGTLWHTHSHYQSMAPPTVWHSFAHSWFSRPYFTAHTSGWSSNCI